MAQLIFKTSEKFEHVQALRAGQTIADHGYEKLDQSDLIQLSLAYAQRESNRYRFTPVSQRGNAEEIKASIEALKNFNVSKDTFEVDINKWFDLLEAELPQINFNGEWISPDKFVVRLSHNGIEIGSANFYPNTYGEVYILDVPENFQRKLYFSELFKVKPWTEDQLWSAVKSDNWTNSIWDYVETH
jgi:hypothetical protein